MVISLPAPPALPIPHPCREEVAALRVVEGYRTRAGTHLASRLLGSPEPDHEAALAAELSNALLRGAALCAGLRDLSDTHDHPNRLL